MAASADRFEGVGVTMSDANSVYAVRTNAFSPTKTFQITSEGVEISAQSKGPRLIPWQDFVAVDLRWAGTRYAANRHVCRWRLRDGTTEEVPSCSYEGFARFRDQGAEFSAFVRTFHEALAARGSGVQFGSEESRWRRCGRWAAAAGLIALVGAFAIVVTSTDAARGTTLAKLLLLVALLPALLRWARRRPGERYDPRTVPAERLPKEKKGMTARMATTTSLAWWMRVAVAGVMLWLIWVGWRPVADVEWAKVEQPQTMAAVRQLPAGTEFLIRGRVEPMPDDEGREWQGRFVFRHRQRRDLSSSSGKTVRVVTVAEHRPALRWVGEGGEWVLPADSYGLARAPRIEPRFWPRKWLWTTRVDDWDRSSTGFRAGDTVWARGHAQLQGTPVVAELWGDPWEPILDREAAAVGMRRWLILGAKIAASVLALAVIAPLWRRQH